MDVEERGPEAMDVKERKPYRSLTRRRDAERRYTSSSADSEEGKAPQKSYSSSETLKAYDQDARLAYGSRVKDMVPQEAEEFCRTGECTLWRGLSPKGYRCVLDENAGELDSREGGGDSREIQVPAVGGAGSAEGLQCSSLLGQTCFLGQLPRSESWLEAALRYQPGIKLFGYPWSLC